MKTLGIIGGLGPLASAYLAELMVRDCDVACDQQHIDTIIYSHPSVPDRTAHILDKSKPSPVPEIVKAGLTLKAAGASCIAIPCVTSHYFYDEICKGIGLPVINMLQESAQALKSKKAKKVGILATSGTVSTGLFQNTLKEYGIDTVLPDAEHQAVVMHIIYDCIKAGRPASKTDFDRVCRHLTDKGADSFVLGCTELSLISRDCVLDNRFVDSLEVLAVSCLKKFGLPIKQDKRNTKCVDL